MGSKEDASSGDQEGAGSRQDENRSGTNERASDAPALVADQADKDAQSNVESPSVPGAFEELSRYEETDQTTTVESGDNEADRNQAMGGEAQGRGRATRSSKHQFAILQAQVPINQRSNQQSIFSRKINANSVGNGANDGNRNSSGNKNINGGKNISGNKNTDSNASINGNASINDNASINSDAKSDTMLNKEAPTLTGALRVHGTAVRGTSESAEMDDLPPTEDTSPAPELPVADNTPAPVHAELVRTSRIGVSPEERRRIESDTRQRMLLEATEAQVVSHGPHDKDDDTTPPQEEKQKRRRMVLPFVCCSIVAIAAIVVIALAATGEFDKSGSNGVRTTNIADAPTTPPSTDESPHSPSVSTNPTPSPSPNPTPPTSTNPTLSPSMNPTQSPTLGDNRDCNSAHPIGIGNDNKVIASTANRELEEIFHRVCEADNISSGFGLWYRFRSDKTQPVTAYVTDGYSAYVFDAPPSSDNVMQCLYMPCISSIITDRDLRHHSWIAEPWRDYFIAVLRDGSGSPDTFELSVWPNSNSMFAYGPINPTGNELLLPGSIASDASSIPPDGDSSVILRGNNRRLAAGRFSSTNATMDDSLAPSCGPATAQTTQGAWYSVIGNGEAIAVTTCGRADWDTQISVFEFDTHSDDPIEYYRWRNGEISLESLLSSRAQLMTCHVGDDDSCSSQQSRARWMTTEGQMYYILVHGKPGEAGDFVLSVSDFSITGVVPGDFCVNALDINDAVFVVSDDPNVTGDNVIPNEDFIDCTMGGDIFLVSATPDSDVPPACYHTLGAPISDSELPIGLWYEVDGTGKLFTLKTPFGTQHAWDVFGLSVMKYPRGLGGNACTRLTCMIAECINGCSWQTEEDYVYVLYGYGYEDLGSLQEGLAFYIIES